MFMGRLSDLLGDGDEGCGEAEHHDEEARGGHGEVEQQQQGGGLLAVHLHTQYSTVQYITVQYSTAGRGSPRRTPAHHTASV